MTARSASVRLLTLLLAALHLTVLGAAEIADARLVREALRSEPHVESAAHGCSVPVHPAQCSICSFLHSPPQLVAVHVQLGAVVRPVRPSAPVRPAGPVPAPPSGLLLPRAPPSLA